MVEKVPNSAVKNIETECGLDISQNFPELTRRLQNHVMQALSLVDGGGIESVTFEEWFGNRRLPAAYRVLMDLALTGTHDVKGDSVDKDVEKLLVTFCSQNPDVVSRIRRCIDLDMLVHPRERLPDRKSQFNKITRKSEIENQEMLDAVRLAHVELIAAVLRSVRECCDYLDAEASRKQAFLDDLSRS